MKSKREIARSSRAMTNGAFTAMTGRSSFPRLCEAAERSRESAPRITKGLAALLMALALVFGFASCKTESEEETVYRTVTYSTEHATAPEKLTVTDGTALTAEQLPALTESGYAFGGWYDGETKAEAGYKVTKDVTLTAKWTAVGTGGSDPQNPDTPTAPDDGGNTSEATKYTVTFSTNGGTTVAAQKIESGKTATEPTAPTKDGYTFGGWFTDSNFATAFTFSTAITADITLYAKWIEASKPTYTVTFSTNGGTEIASEKIESGKTATEPTAPTKDGYTFGGWFTDSNFATAFTFSTAITGNITLYAKWIEASKPTYTVTFSSDGAETKQIVAEGEKAVKPADPTKEGYTFAGWFNGESAFDFETAITENITLTAKWTLITYTVTFTTNGGTEVASQKIESGKTATEPTSPTKEGFTFGGWFTDSNFTTAFTFSTAIKSDITLYAKWIESSKPTYTVTFTVDGAETKQTIAEGGKVSKPTDPTKTGYTFDGWYKDDTKFDFETTVTANLTLTAKWTLITYTITYEGLNGVENPNTATSYTVDSETITLQNPTKSGYTFVWMNGSEEVTQITKGSTGNITLTGKWTAISYEITYVLPDVVTNPNTVTSYTVETETITLQDFSHDDYTFEGWFDAETGGNRVTSIPKGSTGNKTLYAHCTWKWIGAKNPPTAKAVGDIVFNDGSATAYTNGLTLTSEQKAAAVAVIFYAGSASDTLGAKTLGVGLAQNQSGLAWCTNSANAYNVNITTIQCAPDNGGSAGNYTFTGATDKDGSDNFEQIASFSGVSDTATEANYPAFYYAKNYASQTGSHVSGTAYADGWYLPSLAELFQVWKSRATVDAAIEACGGTKFNSSVYYWSSSQYASYDFAAYTLDFVDGVWHFDYKTNSYRYVCVVRAFN